MVHYIFYSLLGLGMLQQEIAASPVHTRREAAGPLDIITPVNAILDAVNNGGPWPPTTIEWPFEKTEPTWTKENPLKDGDKPPDSDEGGEVHARNEISRAFISNSCDDTQKYQIVHAWEEARDLVDAQTGHRDGYPYKIPHSQWLGKDWNSWGWVTPDFGARNRDNFSRLKAAFSKSAPKNDYLYFQCHDPKRGCKKDDKGNVVIAYSYSEISLWWTNHYINFCEPWERYPTVYETVDQVKDNRHEQKVMENFERSRGSAMLHEIWHLKDLISKPQTKDYVYEAQNCWNLAKDKGTWWATENADSYTMDALAIYVQQHFSSAMSPVPRGELEKLDAEAFKNTKEPSEKEKHITTIYPTVDKSSEAYPRIADKKDWTEITFDLWPETEKPKDDEGEKKDKDEKPEEGPINCNKATDDTYVIRDKFMSVVDEFCDMAEKQGHPDTDSRSISRKRFSGTVNELSITIDWEPGLDFKPNSGDCKRIMGEIADSCDVPGQYKGGGEKSVGKVTYKWKPETKHKFWAGCEWKYWPSHNQYWVWGAGWSKDGGDKLKDRVQATGIAATLFDHKWGGGEDDREWTATFNTIIGTAGKVEKVIEDLVGHDFDVWCRQT